MAAPEAIPLARILGDELGQLGAGPARGERRRASTWAARSWASTAAAGDWTRARSTRTWSSPASASARASRSPRPRGLKVENGVVVDALLRASAPGVYAVGDVARYPGLTSPARPVRVEHWVHAERQGQHVARARSSATTPPSPTRRSSGACTRGQTINYVGHAEAFDSVEVDGALSGQDAVVRFKQGGKVMAVATVGRDLDSLKAGAAFEREAG